MKNLYVSLEISYLLAKHTVYVLLSTTYIHTKAEDEATLAGAYRLPQHANGFFNLEIGQKSQILIFNLKMLNFRFDGLAANI